MADFNSKVEELQREFCAERGAHHVPARPDLKSGIALATKGSLPVNGLRYPAEAHTTGWYLWCGEDLSSDPDFFSPICTSHIYEDYPELTKLLGLPPGYRFLAAGDYLDVWFDVSLLSG